MVSSEAAAGCPASYRLRVQRQQTVRHEPAGGRPQAEGRNLPSSSGRITRTPPALNGPRPAAAGFARPRRGRQRCTLVQNPLTRLVVPSGDARHVGTTARLSAPAVPAESRRVARPDPTPRPCPVDRRGRRARGDAFPDRCHAFRWWTAIRDLGDDTRDLISSRCKGFRPTGGVAALPLPSRTVANPVPTNDASVRCA